MSLGHLSPGGGSSGGSSTPSSMSSPSGLLSSPIQSSIKRKRSGTVLNRLHQLLFGEGYSPPQVEQDADKKASEQLPTKKAQSILSQSLLKMNKANAMTTRLSVISEFSEFVRSYRVDDISSVWSAVKDLFDDDKSNEVKLFGFTLLQALIEGQYDQLSPSTRGEFFRIIAKHRRNSPSMWSDSLVALTRNGRDIVPFEVSSKVISSFSLFPFLPLVLLCLTSSTCRKSC
jgi:hypothetical protein